MSSKFSSAFVVTLLLSHTVLAPLTAVAQEQDASPQQVQKTTDSNSNESVEAVQKEGAESIDDGKPDKTPQDASPQQVQGTTDSTLNESAEAAQRAVADPIDNWMPDKALQAAVAKALKLDVSQITKADMSRLTSLDGNNAGIASLAGLQYASNLSFLALGENQISDITPLQHLSNLSWLALGQNQISDVTPLRDLSNLQHLGLDDNHVSDLTPLQNLNLSKLYASRQTITLPTIYVLNKQPYSASVQTAIKNLNGTTPTISPQNNDTWTGVYNSGKVEWSSANQVPETGDLVLTWTDQNTSFTGKCVQPYVLSKASITAHNSTIYVGDNWQARDNFDSALDHDGNPLDFSKIAVAGTVDTSRPGVYSVVYSYDGLEEKVEVTVEEKPSTSEPSKGEVTPEEKPSAPEASKGEVTPEGKPSNSEPSKGEVQSKKEKASKELPATGEKDTKIFSAIGLGILAILGTYISRKKRSDS